MCNKCNKKSNNCGCEEVNAKCVIYKGVCLDNLEVCSGDNLEHIIKIINDLIAEILFDNAKGTTLSNIGEGVGIVHNENSITKDYEIRSVKKGDESIDVYLDGDTIKVSVNKDWFQENLPVIPEPEEFVLTSNKNTILINDKNIEVNPNMFFSANGEELVITEEPDGRLKFDVKVENLIKSVGSGTPLFTGLDMTDGRNKIRTLSFESDTLNIQGRANDTEGVVITIDTYPEDPNMKYFYVNVLYNGVVEDGSIGRPYKTLDNALNAYIGTGSAITPQYRDTARIILMTDVEVDRKLYVNKVNIDCNGFIINYRGTDNYYIDSEYLANTVVGYDGSGNLRDDVRVNFKDLNLKVYTEGAIKNKAIVSPNGRHTSISLRGTTVIKDYSYTKYRDSMTTVKDINNQDVILFGEIVYKMPSNGINIPIIHNEGYIQTGEGSLSIDNLDIELWNNTAIKLIGTSFGLESLIVIRNPYNIPYSNLFEGRIPYSKEGLYVIHNQNSWFKIDRHEDNISSYTEASPSGIRHEYISSQIDSYIYIENTLVNKNRGDVIIKDGYIYAGLGNNFAKLTKNTALEIDNCDYSSFSSVDKFIVENPNTTETSNMTLNMNYSNIKHMDEISNLSISAPFTVVNGSVYTTYPGFDNDVDAKNSGLIKNNMYFNTKSNSFTRIL